MKKGRKSLSDKMFMNTCYIVLAVYAIFCMLPIVLAFSGSLSSEQSILENGFTIIPKDFSFETYQYVFARQGYMLLKAYMNTIIVTIVGTVLSVTITLSYAYVTSVRNFKYGNFFNFFAYLTMLFTSGMLPWYLILTKYYGLKDSIWALILPYCMNVFYMYLARNFFKGIPHELVESAKMDGAGHFTIYCKIMIPLAKAGIVTVSLFYALQYWNDYYLPLMLINDDNLYTIQFILYKMMSNIQFLSTSGTAAAQFNIPMPTQTIKMAITCIAIGPLALMFPFCQKYFMKGVMVGALKG